MRSVAVGLIAAVFAAALSPVSAFAKDKPAVGQGDAKSHQQGMAEAGPIVQQLGLDCTPSDANLVGTSKSKDASGKEVNQKIYEVVCKEGLGWMVLAPEGGQPSAFDCLALTQNKPQDGKDDGGKLFCRLPPNQNPLAAMAPIMSKAGISCQPSKAQWMGGNDQQKFNQYEVACSDGADYVLQVPERGSSHALTAISCLTTEAGVCKLQTPEERLAQFKAMAAPANRTACDVKDARYIGTSQSNKNTYYEIGCADGKSGYILQVDAANKFVTSIDCARASTMGLSCSLTSAVAAQTDEVNTYNRLAKEIGLDCNVKSYHSFGIDQASGREVVELACANRPASVVAMMPVDKGQTGEFFNCARAAGMNIKCSLSPMSATYAEITNEIQASGKSCKVNNARFVGKTADGNSYLEVTCSGEPGLMLQYGPGPEKLTTAMACLTARGIGGGCKLQ